MTVQIFGPHPSHNQILQNQLLDCPGNNLLCSTVCGLIGIRQLKSPVVSFLGKHSRGFEDQTPVAENPVNHNYFLLISMKIHQWRVQNCSRCWKKVTD